MRDHTVRVHPMPGLVAADDLDGSAVVVIDLLRATTTITQALVSGATEVVPFLEIDDAMAAAERVGRDGVVLGGERRGVKIEGFDLGNSPAEYTAEEVDGKRVFITTTNGTRALNHAARAARVIVGAIVNLSAVCESVRSEPHVDLLCAGTDGKPTREDLLCAGAIVHMICGGAESPTDGAVWRANEAAVAARSEWEEVLVAARKSGRTLSQQLSLELRDTAGGKNLIEIGLDVDLADCAQVDRFDMVGELEVREWRITVR